MSPGDWPHPHARGKTDNLPKRPPVPRCALQTYGRKQTWTLQDPRSIPCRPKYPNPVDCKCATAAKAVVGGRNSTGQRATWRTAA